MIARHDLLQSIPQRGHTAGQGHKKLYGTHDNFDEPKGLKCVARFSPQCWTPHRIRTRFVL